MNHDRPSTFRNHGAIPLPENRAQRIKLVVALCVIAIGLIWLLIYVGSSLTSGGRSTPRETTESKLVHDLTLKLIADPRFADTSIGIVTERPLAMKVAGGVKSAKDLEALKMFMKEIRPEGDYEIDVELISP